MTSQSNSVVRLSASQTESVVQVMSRAFFSDPMFTYILPNDQTRRVKLPWFFHVGIRYGLRYGEVYTTANAEGGAIWLSPGNTTFTFGRMLQTGMLAMPFAFGWAGFERFMNLNDYAEKAHKQSVSGEQWYLLGLGVEPSKQGQGIGGMLIQPILARADVSGLPCYLETVNESNLPFYEKHGFQVKVSGQVPKDGPKFWAMVRPPHK